MSRIRSTSVWEEEADAIKAAGACSRALQRLRLPQLLGRIEAFCHDHDVIGPPRIASKEALTAVSNWLAAWEI